MNSDEWQVAEILRQETGRFDRRLTIGPAQWPHFDLLWIHEGAVQVTLGRAAEPLLIDAPGGVLIFPDVAFSGRARNGGANASICHFTATPGTRTGAGAGAGTATSERFLRCEGPGAFHVQNLVAASLALARGGAPMAHRQRLLAAILDWFSSTSTAPARTRLDEAWSRAEARLAHMRGLADVAAEIGLSESSLRAMHRKRFGAPAGKHLTNLRMRTAERLLATTGMSIFEVSAAVGYAHAESFTASFSRSRGQSPNAYRRWCRRFA